MYQAEGVEEFVPQCFGEIAPVAEQPAKEFVRSDGNKLSVIYVVRSEHQIEQFVAVVANQVDFEVQKPAGTMRASEPSLWETIPNSKQGIRDVIEIPTTCNGMHEKAHHPTQKPEKFLRKLILASSNVRNLIVDLFLSSGTTAVVAEQLRCHWKGCDI